MENFEIWPVATKLDERGVDVAGGAVVLVGEGVVATIVVYHVAVVAHLFCCEVAKILDIWRIPVHLCRG